MTMTMSTSSRLTNYKHKLFDEIDKEKSDHHDNFSKCQFVVRMMKNLGVIKVLSNLKIEIIKLTRQ